MVNLNEITVHADLDAHEYAWGQLMHLPLYLPFDGGIVKVEYSAEARTMFGRWDTELDNRVVLGYVHEYVGESRARTEEGYRNVYVRVMPSIHREYDEHSDVIGFTTGHDWYVEVQYETADCDGRYSSGHTVHFESGTEPSVERDLFRDHSAEAAGY